MNDNANVKRKSKVLADVFDAAARTLGIAVYRQASPLAPTAKFRTYVGPYSDAAGGIVPLPGSESDPFTCLADDVKQWLGGLARAGVQSLAIQPDEPMLVKNDRGEAVWLARVSGGPEVDQRELHQGDGIPWTQPAKTDQPEAPLFQAPCLHCGQTTTIPLGTLDPKQGACAHVFTRDVAMQGLVCMCGLRVSGESLAACGFVPKGTGYDARANELADKLTTAEDTNSRLTADVSRLQRANQALERKTKKGGRR